MGLVRAVLRYAKKLGKYKGDVSMVIPDDISNAYVPRERALAHAEYQALWLKLSEDRRDYLDGWCYQGPRESELYGIRPEDVRFDQRDHGMLHINGTKTNGSDRWVPIAEEVLPMFEQRVAMTAPGAPLFPPWGNVRRDLNAACDRAGIPHVSCNDFRRTFATWLGEGGQPELVTASLMGHASTAMVRRVYRKIGSAAQQRAIAALPSMPALGAIRTVAGPVRNPGSGGRPGRPGSRSSSEVVVPRDGVEPPTRGFSVRLTPAEIRNRRGRFLTLLRAV